MRKYVYIVLTTICLGLLGFFNIRNASDELKAIRHLKAKYPEAKFESAKEVSKLSLKSRQVKVKDSNDIECIVTMTKAEIEDSYEENKRAKKLSESIKDEIDAIGNVFGYSVKIESEKITLNIEAKAVEDKNDFTHEVTEKFKERFDYINIYGKDKNKEKIEYFYQK